MFSNIYDGDRRLDGESYITNAEGKCPLLIPTPDAFVYFHHLAIYDKGFNLSACSSSKGSKSNCSNVVTNCKPSGGILICEQLWK
ncbi:hypothetical protein Peur_069724 [Populus x canadensis]